MRPDSRDETWAFGSKAFFPASTMSSIILGCEFLDDEELAILPSFPSHNGTRVTEKLCENSFLLVPLEPSCAHHTVAALYALYRQAFEDT